LCPHHTTETSHFPIGYLVSAHAFSPAVCDGFSIVSHNAAVYTFLQCGDPCRLLCMKISTKSRHRLLGPRMLCTCTACKRYCVSRTKQLLDSHRGFRSSCYQIHYYLAPTLFFSWLNLHKVKNYVFGTYANLLFPGRMCSLLFHIALSKLLFEAHGPNTVAMAPIWFTFAMFACACMHACLHIETIM
jgi:hypothetical protein